MTAHLASWRRPFDRAADAGRHNLPKCGGVRLSRAADHYSYPAEFAGLDGR